MADEMAALYPVSVEISLYGARAETHDGITLVPGSFSFIVTALFHTRRAGRPFR